MSFFADFFHQVKKTESVILIDIGAGSVAGAYARYKEGDLPTLLYTRRLPIELRKDEPHEKGMLRALQILGDTLIKEGAPILARATGSGSASDILVSVDAPWQKTSVRTELYEEEAPFVFTKSLVASLLERNKNKKSEQEFSDESITGTILNGYETRNPYGKKARRVALIVLTSTIDARVAKSIIATLRSVYHTKHILPIAGDSLRYQAMRKTFPYERSALIIDATGALTTVALVRKGLFVAVIDIPDSDTPAAWAEHIKNKLADLAKSYPLPRTIFLLAREPEVASLQEALGAAKLGELWYSENPPKITAVLASHFSDLVKQVTTATPDTLLLFMALYWQHRVSAD